jgi:hypothetical protein
MEPFRTTAKLELPCSTELRCCMHLQCQHAHRQRGDAHAGWALFASMVAMSAMAVPWVAARCFAAFYRTHVLFALLTGVLALLHGFGSAVWNGYAPASVPGAIFWLADAAIRVAFMNCAALHLGVSTIACSPLRPLHAQTSCLLAVSAGCDASACSAS